MEPPHITIRCIPHGCDLHAGAAASCLRNMCEEAEMSQLGHATQLLRWIHVKLPFKKRLNSQRADVSYATLAKTSDLLVFQTILCTEHLQGFRVAFGSSWPTKRKRKRASCGGCGAVCGRFRGEGGM